MLKEKKSAKTRPHHSGPELSNNVLQYCIFIFSAFIGFQKSILSTFQEYFCQPNQISLSNACLKHSIRLQALNLVIMVKYQKQFYKC